MITKLYVFLPICIVKQLVMAIKQSLLGALALAFKYYSIRSYHRNNELFLRNPLSVPYVRSIHLVGRLLIR